MIEKVFNEGLYVQNVSFQKVIKGTEVIKNGIT